MTPVLKLFVVIIIATICNGAVTDNIYGNLTLVGDQSRKLVQIVTITENDVVFSTGVVVHENYVITRPRACEQYKQIMVEAWNKQTEENATVAAAGFQICVIYINNITGVEKFILRHYGHELKGVKSLKLYDYEKDIVEAKKLDTNRSKKLFPDGLLGTELSSKEDYEKIRLGSAIVYKKNISNTKLVAVAVEGKERYDGFYIAGVELCITDVADFIAKVTNGQVTCRGQNI